MLLSYRFRRSKTGHFFALQTAGSGSTVGLSYGDFYSPMWYTASKESSCKVRFFYFINGPPETVRKTKLQLYVRYATKAVLETSPIAEVSLGSAEELQQRWNMAVVK